MRIDKILNNNVITSINENDEEVIIMGKGIAFNKRCGDIVIKDKIEKVFVLSNPNMNRKFIELISKIPLEYTVLSEKIISYARKELDKTLNENIYISLTDHIYNAIQRQKSGIVVTNGLIWETKRLYKEEYKIALWAVDYINNRLKIDLPEDEAGFIALHLVNASYQETAKESVLATNIIKGVLNIIRYYYSVEFNEEDLNYDRLLTHLKYFAKRVITNNQNDDNSSEFLEIASRSYPEAYDCAKKIQQYIESNYDYKVNEDEIVYLTMHIHRVISVLRSNH